jgi:hypothetical protein
MENISLVYPFINITAGTDVVPAIKAVIDTLPLFTGCCIESAESPYYVSGEPITDTNNMVYKYNRYGHSLFSNIFTVYNNTTTVMYKLGDNSTNVWASPFNVKSSADTTYSNPLFKNLKQLQMYTLKTSTTNGFWWFYFANPKYYTVKTFLTKSIDENSGAESYVPIVSKNYTTGDTNNFCRVYVTDDIATDIKNRTVMRSGMSNAYVLKQLRISNFLYPDVYIISGGLCPTEQEIIYLDNNEYIHLTNDIFIKAK